MKHSISISLAKRTRLSFIAMRLLGTPLWTLLSMLVYILYKQVGLNPLQITCIVALKPTSSLLSPYWSHAIYKRPHKLTANLLGANFLKYFFFLWLPWVDSVWLIIFAFGVYMTLSRGAIPAWTEIFQSNLPSEQREQLISYATTIDYLGTAIMSVLLGVILDFYPDQWRWLFGISALLGILSTTLLTLIHPHMSDSVQKPICLSGRSANKGLDTLYRFKKQMFRPWKAVSRLLLKRSDFMVFQWGFMLGGSALMIIQPALPRFFMDTLKLSFVEMGCAISLCKGLGVALSSSIWMRLFRKITIFQFSSLVTHFAAIFPFFLLASYWQGALLYFAYGLYGVMQAGSEMSWHMSSLVFSRGSDSSLFSITNVLTVGIRGCLVPILGSLLLCWLQPSSVIVLSAFLALAASIYFRYNSCLQLDSQESS